MSDEAKIQRDWWDKAEICGKILGAVIVPLAVAVVALIWNSQSSSRQSAAQMSAIAIGILQAEAKPGVDSNALREWAVAVLQRPSDPPVLSDDVAQELLQTGLPIWYGKGVRSFDLSGLQTDRLSDIADALDQASDAFAKRRALSEEEEEEEEEKGGRIAPVIPVEPVIIPNP